MDVFPRSPSLVNFGLIDKYPDLPGYREVSPPTVELVGDMAHVYVCLSVCLSDTTFAVLLLSLFVVPSHPLTVSAVLKARSFTDVCFVTDAVFNSKTPGESINYCGRKCEDITSYWVPEPVIKTSY